MVVAAPQHDVGKIHIPDAVLKKPGKLDDNEFTMMKSHAAAGGKIIDRVEESVGGIEYLRIAKEMAEYHHEPMDGKGYPTEYREMKFRFAQGFLPWRTCSTHLPQSAATKNQCRLTRRLR